MHGIAVLVSFAVFKFHLPAAYYAECGRVNRYAGISRDYFSYNIEWDLFKNRICFAHCQLPLFHRSFSKVVGCEPYGLYLLAGILLHCCATMRSIDGSMPCRCAKQAWECNCEGQGKGIGVDYFTCQYILLSDTVTLRFVNVCITTFRRFAMTPRSNHSPMNFKTMAVPDVPQGRKGKHNDIVTQILSDLDQVKEGIALKVPLAGLAESKEKVRSALNRATRKAGLKVVTASDKDFLYVWNEKESA
jgi:hypothetical protein